jgi:hypothetical protein
MLPKKWGNSHGQKHRSTFISGRTHRANRLAQGSGEARATSSSMCWEIPRNFAPTVAKLWISMEFEVDPCGGGHGAHEKRSTGSRISRRHCPRGSSRSRRNLCRVHDRGRDCASAPAVAREKAKEVKSQVAVNVNTSGRARWWGWLTARQAAGLAGKDPRSAGRRPIDRDHCRNVAAERCPSRW